MDVGVLPPCGCKGNHTLLHPCLVNTKRREWVKGEQDRSTYSVQRIENEVRMTDVFLVSLEAHRALLHYLKQRENNIWIAPMINVGEYIKSLPATQNQVII